MEVVEGIQKRIVEIKEFIINADILVYVDEDDTDGIKKRVKQLIEATFVMEDVLDDYVIFTEQKDPRPPPPGCSTSSSCGIFDFIKDIIRRHQIKCMFQKLESQFREIIQEAGGQIQPTSEQGSRSGENQIAANLPPQYRRTNGDVVVGFDRQSAQLIDWLVKGKEELTVISVVGMGGVGKTTLATEVFNSKVVCGHFDCCVWVTVSPSYTIEGLLKDLLCQFYNQESISPPPGIFAMDRNLLVDEVRNYLKQKRYVIFFDDVWNRNFWYDIQLVLIDNRKGSRVFITTRNMDVAGACKSSSFVHVHKIQPLTLEESTELFRMKAFQFDYKGNYPKDLDEMTSEIVSRCGGLPLALVLVGSSLSHIGKKNNVFEWKMFSRNLSSHFGNNSYFHHIRKILNTSYEALPSHLKVCLLYFAIYPPDHAVKSNRLIRQWIAEGFVKEESDKTLEQVAKGYLTELVRRSLLQEFSVRINGEIQGCCAHDLVRDLILEKTYHFCFSMFISEDCQNLSSGIIRHLSIATSFLDSIENIESSHVRSLHFFTEEELPQNLVKRIPTKYKRLNVIDFENAGSLDVPENLGDLIHLKYVSFRNTKIQSIPQSIGNLQSLETLDLRQTDVNELPKEISKLTKLRHLLGTNMSLIHLKGEIGGMKPLQTLSEVRIDEDGLELITELGKLTQLRKLSLSDVREEHGIALCSSINEMPHLEKLYIETKYKDEHIDLSFVSDPAMLRKLRLQAKLIKLPEWIPKLENLVELSMSYSHLTEDPLEQLQNLPNLLVLNLEVHSYEGDCLQFQVGGFKNLKEIGLRYLYNLECIIIEEGALQLVKELTIMNIPNLKTAPSGIEYLENLEVLKTYFMPTEFMKSTTPFAKRVKSKNFWK